MARKIDTDAEIDRIRIKDQVGDPAAPGAGYRYFYSKAGGLYMINSAGTVYGPINGASDADYWVETANGSLSAEVVVGTTGITTATYATRQAAAKAGRIFLPSDGYYIERDTGAAWASWGPVWPMTPPVTGDFSWINQGTGTITSTYGGDYIYAPADATSDWRIRIKSAPATPYTITIALIPSLAAANYAKAGFIWRQSSDGKLVNCAVQYGGGRIISADKWTDADTYSANYASVSQYSYPTVYWLQASDTGANRVLRYSYDGTNFREIHSVGRTDFMTANQVGFGVSSENASNWAGALFLSWKET